MKHLSRRMWIAIGFLAAGVLISALWEGWVLSRIDHPVFMPVNLAAHTLTTPEFRATSSRPYDIAIAVENRFSPEMVICMMGLPLDPEMSDCDPARRLLRANWIVYGRGGVVAQGSTAAVDRLDTMTDRWNMTATRFGGPVLERPLGSFEAQRGERYRIEVTVTQFQPLLAGGSPHLRVVPDPLFPENMAALRALTVTGTVLCEIVGVLLLLAEGMRRRRNGEKSNAAVGHAA